MARYRVQGQDGVHVIEGPDDATPEEIESFAAQVLTPKPTGKPVGMGERIVKGMMDPITGGAQLLTHMLPNGVVESVNNANNWLADKTGLVAKLPTGGVDQQVREAEAAYQGRRAASGETGFDGARLVGNLVSPANLAIAARTPAVLGLGARIGVGAGSGAVAGSLNPVTQGDDFATEKAKQIALGGAFGGAVPAIGNALARVISPRASTNPNVNMLMGEGVKPTIGQTLGGVANSIEEKAQSIPILGDAIRAARDRAKDTFNVAAINRAVEPVGGKVTQAGQAGVTEAGNMLSKAYDDAVAQVPFFKLDNTYKQSRAQLDQLAQGLVPTLRAQYKQAIKDVVDDKISTAGAMLGTTFKEADSELGQLASQWRSSSVTSERKLGDAIAQAQALLREQLGRSHPQAAAALKAADEGWANLVRVEGAAKTAKNAEGVFTPGMLNTAIQTADKSVRKRAVSRGEALMQDLGNAGQQVLGNRVPDSGTTSRMLLGAGAMGAGAINPLIPAGLIGGAAAYTPQVQNLLRASVLSRPQAAQPIANALQRTPLGFAPAAAQLGLGLLN